MTEKERYPPLAHYGLIGDCHTAALVSRDGSIDWLCLPRFDSGSCFGRLLDWQRGGCCSIRPTASEVSVLQAYVEDTLVLVTTFQTAGGEASLIDCLATDEQEGREPRVQLLRVIEGKGGEVEFRIRIEPRFDYGEVRPWIRRHSTSLFTAIGGDDGLVLAADLDLEEIEDQALQAVHVVREGQRARLSVRFARPEEMDPDVPEPPEAEELDRQLDETLDWWRKWSRRTRSRGAKDERTLRSAMILKALTYAPTGAIVGAATTSVPGEMGGSRNWDYRYSWVRDSTFSVRSLAELGHKEEADRFRRFVQRSAAGHADDLQVTYGVGGERLLTEEKLEGLDGYRGARPVRVGNSAARQRQHDVYGELLNLAWRWHRRGHAPDDDDWRFLSELVEAAARRWSEPDRGIWEWRGDPQHFVHSKAMCWVAVDRGLRLADECGLEAPTARWANAREEIRGAIEEKGYDSERGVFGQTFGGRELDAALLLLPWVEFIAWDDERMIRTTDAIREELEDDGLIRRYKVDDGIAGKDGPFVCCSFWLAECLVRQGRVEQGREVFNRALQTANGLGLFSEQFDPRTGEMLGNFPQALSHLSHITASLALAEHEAAAKDTLPSASDGSAP